MTIDRLMKASDKVLAKVISNHDDALRKEGFTAPWIKVSGSGAKFAEADTKTEKGHDVRVRTYISKTNPTVSYARTWYGKDFERRSENYFIVCDTEEGRKVYYKPVRQDRFRNQQEEQENSKD